MSESNKYQPLPQEDEISLRDLILLVLKYVKEVLKYWWAIGIVVILLAGVFAYRAYKAPVTYLSDLSYTVSESGLSGIAGGLLGRFVGGRGGCPVMKMQAMMTSRKIMERVLLRKEEVDGIDDYLINHHARIYKYAERIEDYSPITSAVLASKENKSIFKKVIKDINKTLLSQSLDEETGIASFSVTSISEEYAYTLTEVLFEELDEFYRETELKEQRATLKSLEHAADSIYKQINKLTYAVAQKQDNDRGRFFAIDQVDVVKTQAEIEFLSKAFIEVSKNLETVKFTVASTNPAISLIDPPMYPLKDQRKSFIIQGIIGGFIGGFLSALFILARRIFIDIMQYEEGEEESEDE